MITIIAACVVFAGYLVIAWKLDRIDRHMVDTADRYFSMQEAYRKAERAHNLMAEKLEHVERHFVYSPVNEPVALPTVDEETAQAVKPKRKRSR